MSAGQRDPPRVYEAPAIEVHWEPRLCIHTGNCVRGLPEVFDPRARPWVTVEAADADAIARTVETCPSGALHYRRRDGAPQERPAAQTTVAASTDGPLLVRGDVRVVDADGTLLRADTRLALCRCGASGNKPFCDGSHRRVGFRSAPAADR